jgi:hypothetical protein
MKMETFLGPAMATSENNDIWAQKGKIFRAHPSNGPSNAFVPIKIIKFKLYIKKTGTLVS